MNNKNIYDNVFRGEHKISKFELDNSPQEVIEKEIQNKLIHQLASFIINKYKEDIIKSPCYLGEKFSLNLVIFNQKQFKEYDKNHCI